MSTGLISHLYNRSHLLLVIILFVDKLSMHFFSMATVVTVPKIRIVAGGATIPLDVYKAWKPVYQAYRSHNAEVVVAYDGTGSGEGIKRFKQNQYDFAGSDAELVESDYDNSTDIQMFPSMAGPVSISYNIPEMKRGCVDERVIQNCLNLTRSAIVGIFNGTIRYWNDPALVEHNQGLRTVNASITVVIREDGSGTTDLFTSALAAFDVQWKAVYSHFSEGCDTQGKPLKWNKNLITVCGAKARGASGMILNNKYSIGYLGTSDARDSLLPQARILNQANRWTGPNVDGINPAMDTVVEGMGPRLTGSLVDSPATEAYPINGFTYLIIRKKAMKNCTLAMEMFRYFTYVLEDSLARTIIIEQYKAPLTKSLYDKIYQEVFLQMECNGQNVSELVRIAMAVELGTFDAWKTPVAIIAAVVGMILLMGMAMLAYARWKQNRHVLRNDYVLTLYDASVRKYSKISSRSIDSAVINRERLAIFADDCYVVQLPDGDSCLIRKMCPHFSGEATAGEALQWTSRVLLVRLQEHVSHNHIVKVMGITYHDNIWKMVHVCPLKGCLQDILQHGKYPLNSSFRYSIATDIAEGMTYLHKHGFVHGQLTSGSCYIDARWNALVGDWEQYSLHAAQKATFIAFELQYNEALRRTIDGPWKDSEELYLLSRYYGLLFWSAPEVLEKDYKGSYIVTSATKPSDAYSFGVVAYEIFTNLLPYETEKAAAVLKWTPDNYQKQILDSVKASHIRPEMPDEVIADYPKVVSIIKAAWTDDPCLRLVFSDIAKELKRVNSSQRNIVDTMMETVENYAQSLEDKVTERTLELEKMTKSIKALLYNMLPPSTADKLSRGETIEPEFYDSVTLCFSDVVGFTSIAAASLPIDIVTLLNDLYSAFDFVISNHDVYKVETIGDSYMCISGLPNRSHPKHVTEIADMTLDMISATMAIPIRHMPDRELQIRIGAHSGAVMAGVVGVKMPRYCLFGDTVNTASRMESSSLPMRIQISESTKNLLNLFPVYETVLRGERMVKGKGMMHTFWLIGKEGYTKPLPSFDPAQDDELLILLDESQFK